MTTPTNQPRETFRPAPRSTSGLLPEAWHPGTTWTHDTLTGDDTLTAPPHVNLETRHLVTYSDPFTRTHELAHTRWTDADTLNRATTDEGIGHDTLNALEDARIHALIARDPALVDVLRRESILDRHPDTMLPVLANVVIEARTGDPRNLLRMTAAANQTRDLPAMLAVIDSEAPEIAPTARTILARIDSDPTEATVVAMARWIEDHAPEPIPGEPEPGEGDDNGDGTAGDPTTQQPAPTTPTSSCSPPSPPTSRTDQPADHPTPTTLPHVRPFAPGQGEPTPSTDRPDFTYDPADLAALYDQEHHQAEHDADYYERHHEAREAKRCRETITGRPNWRTPTTHEPPRTIDHTGAVPTPSPSQTRTRGKMRRPARMLTDRRVLRHRHDDAPNLDGGVLIDASGSMSLSYPELEDLCRQAPFALVAAYSGGSFTILAKDGRSIAREELAACLSRGGGSNESDGPSLQRLADLATGPLLWVSDGYATEVGDGCTPRAIADAHAITTRHGIARVEDVEEAQRLFALVKRGKTPAAAWREVKNRKARR